jgi:hypothetical protein
MMDAKVVEFCRLLRENGIRVSVAETMDGLRALGQVGLYDRDTVRAALRATTVKRAIDVPAFESLFDLFFFGIGPDIQATTAATAETLGMGPDELQQLIERLMALADVEGLDLSELARAVLQADTGALERLLREAAGRAGLDEIQQGFQEGRFTHALATALGASAVAEELARLRDLGALGRQPDGERLRGYIDRRLQDLLQMLKALVRQELDLHDVRRRERQGMQALAEKSFFYLTEEEMRRMQEAVTRLAQRLRNIVSIRRRRARRGTFNSSATLRRNLQYGGVPFRIVFNRRRKNRPQIMVLCDVSDSVRNVSRFMLQFVYSLQDLYSRVRSFIFVADIGEVTELFKEHDVNRALDLALQGNVINVYSHSDFGRAFRTFQREYLGAVNKRTTVLILGDARNNYNLPQEWVLRELQQRAKQVVWLNPENRMTWGFGDSEMDRYAPFCDIVEECRNLNQLYRVIDRLVTT